MMKACDTTKLDSTKIFSKELLKGKIALVTGGSNGGMPRETVKAFLEHGCDGVALMSRNGEKLQKVASELQKQYPSQQVVSIPGDVRKWDSCDSVVEQVVAKFGRLDILVNGAAGNFLASAAKLSSNGFKTVLEIDTLGTFNMSKAAFNRAFKGQMEGTIINISALLHWNGTALQAHSSAAKAGVDALTKVLAVEWGPYGVRVNGIVPGAIRGTEGFERLGNLENMNNKDKTNKAMASNSTSKNVGKS